MFDINIAIIVFVIGVIIFKVTHPQHTWMCVFGLHQYGYSHEKHGMYLDKNEKSVTGTQRKIYMCRCGKVKPVEKKDWIKK